MAKQEHGQQQPKAVLELEAFLERVKNSTPDHQVSVAEHRRAFQLMARLEHNGKLPAKFRKVYEAIASERSQRHSEIGWALKKEKRPLRRLPKSRVR